MYTKKQTNGTGYYQYISFVCDHCGLKGKQDTNKGGTLNVGWKVYLFQVCTVQSMIQNTSFDERSIILPHIGDQVYL